MWNLDSIPLPKHNRKLAYKLAAAPVRVVSTNTEQAHEIMIGNGKANLYLSESVKDFQSRPL